MNETGFILLNDDAGRKFPRIAVTQPWRLVEPEPNRHPYLGEGRTKSMAYNQQWASTQPGCLIIMLDQSGSMNGKFAGDQIGAGKRKCDMVATVLNSLLNELIKSNTVGETIKPRADIAVLGYGGNHVGSALSGTLASKEFVTLPELMANPLAVEQRKRREVGDDDSIVDIPVEFPVWVKPRTGTSTPMCAALYRARVLAEKWAAAHPTCYPPVIINVTDGASTDGDPTRAAQDLSVVHTADGAALLFNCHITDKRGTMVEFPGSESEVPNDKYARLLFSFSSTIPNSARETILATTGDTLPPNARGFIFNGDASSVRQMFVYATIGATAPIVDPNR